MSNYLEMAMNYSILTLYEQGWSARKIARELGINRETVGRHVSAAGVKPATGAENPPPGSAASGEGAEGSKPATELSNPPPGASPLPTTFAVGAGSLPMIRRTCAFENRLFPFNHVDKEV
jgi:hypothetical protein